jgi:hypothetical protein
LALTPGTRLGVYDITAPIGEGGADARYLRDTPAETRVEIIKPATGS